MQTFGYDFVVLLALAVAEFCLGLWVGLAITHGHRAEYLDERPAVIQVAQPAAYDSCPDWDVRP